VPDYKHWLSFCCSAKDRALHEEIFGPILSIIQVNYTHQSTFGTCLIDTYSSGEGRVRQLEPPSLTYMVLPSAFYMGDFQVSTWEEAIAIENANPFGNAACIYTTVGAHAQWFQYRFRAAMIGVNIGIPVSFALPYAVVIDTEYHHTSPCRLDRVSETVQPFICYSRQLASSTTRARLTLPNRPLVV
jgi:hypothetical protein